MVEKPDSLAALIAGITPEIHASLKMAVELGHWENGGMLSEEQKALCLQAVIAYDQVNLNPEQRVGYVKPKKDACNK
jgi:hypothetical protein